MMMKRRDMLRMEDRGWRIETRAKRLTEGNRRGFQSILPSSIFDPPSSKLSWLLISILLLGLAACDSGGGEENPGATGTVDACIVPRDQFADGGVGKDGIPALTDVPFVDPETATYLADTDRVIGFMVDGEAFAVPHNILWNHEIANLNFPTIRLAVTYCPLTGSSMVFDRAVIGGGEFGGSGLLFQNNLTMYDRTSSESIWPQMSRRVACGPRLGAELEMIPVIEMTWGGWQALHPDTKVTSDDTGYGLLYTAANYPYGNYEDPDDDGLLFPMEIDPRRRPKERLLGIPDDRLGGTAFPFFELDANGPVQAVHESVAGTPVVVFWDRAVQGAMAYQPRLDGQPLTFEAREGRLVDVETQSEWRIDGTAIAGPLAGARLEPVAEAFVAFWFAWAAFHPETRIWEGE